MRTTQIIVIALTLVICCGTASAGIAKHPHYRAVTQQECDVLQQLSQQYGRAMLDTMAQQWRIPPRMRSYLIARCHLV